MASLRTFEELVAIMDRLRDPGGCPWDREQTYATLRGYLIEECYEVVDALDRADRPALCEELGDLLFQIVFLARLAREDRAFVAADVVEGIAAKMIRRHPHVFGDDTATNAAEVLVRWEEIKKIEKRDAGKPEAEESVLSGIPPALPALVKAQRLGTKAARVGFDWREPEDALAKLGEETGELAAAVTSGDRSAIREELGDALFTLAMIARRFDVDADEALAGANAKFRTRFESVERELRRLHVPIEEAGLELMDRLWNEIKADRAR
jgi:tetrapyrrole methylase family protein/MazG family protein/ATP diphosphatase